MPDTEKAKLAFALDPECPTIWFLAIDPYPAWRPRRLLVGPWHRNLIVPLRMPFFEDDGSERMLLDNSPETWAVLWSALAVEGEVGPLPVLVLGDRPGEKLAGEHNRQALHDLLLNSEEMAGVEVKTDAVDPPLYVEAFWGPRPRGRLDAMIGRLQNFNIMPEPLLERARDRSAESTWAVMTTPDLPQRKEILEALEPLIAHRKGRVMELAAGDSAPAADQACAELANMNQAERPYYLLLLGDFPDISMETQYMLQSFSGLGRLSFERPEDYRRYAEKVIAAEAAAERGRLYYIATDSDDVNQLNYQELVEPLAAHAELMAPAQVLARGRASTARSLGLLRAAPPGSLAFLTAHGFEYLIPIKGEAEAVFAEQRLWQGAPVMDDHPGRVAGAGEGLLSAEMAAAGPFLPQGLLVLDCCYSAGSVQQDTQPEWLYHPMPERLRPPKPFVSAFARAALANPQGPLAVFGHVNRSHQYAYYDPDRTWPSMTFGLYLELLAKLLQGKSMALGREICRRMTVAYMAQCMTISYQIEHKLTGRNRGGLGFSGLRRPIEQYAESFVQYSFGTWNFRNYTILGDPMARIESMGKAA